MTAAGEQIRRAFLGEGPVFEAMLDERARELAAAPEVRRGPADTLSVLVMAGAAGSRWALPLAAVARVEALPRIVAVPAHAAGLLGLAMVAGRRCLVVDLAALADGVDARASDRPGHAVLLRHRPVALAVERAEAIRAVPAPRPEPAGLRAGLLADGTVLLDAGRLAARVNVAPVNVGGGGG